MLFYRSGRRITEEYIPHILWIAERSSGFLFSALLLPWEIEGAKSSGAAACSVCTCSREHGGAVVVSLCIICPQPREALPEEGGGRRAAASHLGGCGIIWAQRFLLGRHFRRHACGAGKIQTAVFEWKGTPSSKKKGKSA